ncbi:MAG: pantoate--beta-alanine ligase [Alphaproteobacteria bacterium]|jgi:pantoate--beta-alanine ligase
MSPRDVINRAAMQPNADIATEDSLDGLRHALGVWRKIGETIALVPTMGALHGGHLALVEEARRRCQRVVVSIFVNPAQFGADEDFASYPREAAKDRQMLGELGVDLIYAPPIAEIYPDGFATEIKVGGLSDGLCAVQRPVHFTGVATVVAKLLIQCRPHVALFGEKDFQQLLIIRRLVRDLDLEVDIIGVPTVRESGGLAMSSRNAALSPAGRGIAGRLYSTLIEVGGRISAGEAVDDTLAWGRHALIAQGFEAVDYLELRHAETLASLRQHANPARLLVAVHLDGVRLIDNIALE